MRLDAMLNGVAVGAVPKVEVSGLHYDSRKLRRGEAFFAFPGACVDGHAFIQRALATGASAIVSEREAPAGLRSRWARVEHGRRALAHAALRFFGHPDRTLRLTAVTGTNGKTTTVHLLDSILRSAGKTTALLGTIEHRVAGDVEKAINTTPESLDIVRYLARLRELGGSHATMEASSHALSLERICGMEFHTAVFTNLTPEHLDFHGNMASYAGAKRRLFEGAGARPPQYAVANAEDPIGRSLLRLGRSQPVSFGRRAGADVRASRIVSDARRLRFDVETPVGSIRAEPRLVGDWNLDNLLAAIAAAQCHGLASAEIEQGIRHARPVPGRFESVEAGQPFLAIIDYAHTEDALRRLIQSGRQLANRRDPPGRVLTLFGCGGDRDSAKRAPMGRAAGDLSDVVVLTSDNPRGENPQSILDEVGVGLRGRAASWTADPDRAAAIAAILGEARDGDVVLIAGKGHETVQIFAEHTIAFDDRKVALAALRDLGYATP